MPLEMEARKVKYRLVEIVPLIYNYQRTVIDYNSDYANRTLGKG
jgi:hypothetical protein